MSIRANPTTHLTLKLVNTTVTVIWHNTCVQRLLLETSVDCCPIILQKAKLSIVEALSVMGLYEGHLEQM